MRDSHRKALKEDREKGEKKASYHSETTTRYEPDTWSAKSAAREEYRMKRKKLILREEGRTPPSATLSRSSLTQLKS